MMFRALASMLLVGHVLGGMITEDHAVAREFISSLVKNVRIDWDNPPTSDSSYMEENTCWNWSFRCRRTKFKISKTLVRLYPSEPGGWRLLGSRPNITVYFIPRVERGVMNRGTNDLALTAEESTSMIDSTSEGWQIGAQMFAGVSAVAGTAGVSISASYSKTWTAGKSLTKGGSIHTTCKANYDCRIETWTFHVRIKGHCGLRPVIECGVEMDPCRRKVGDKTCEQYDNFREENCYTCRVPTPYLYEECEVQTPILDSAGRPFGRIVSVAEKMPAEGGTKVEDAKGRQKAVKLEDGWYQLENGEWYDPKDDTYYGNMNDMWYRKNGAPKPDLSLGVAAPAAAPAAAPSKPTAGCSALKCYRELLHVWGTKAELITQCQVRRRSPDFPLNVNTATFPFTPTCGRMESLLHIDPQLFRPVCQCILTKKSGEQCPDCKTMPCYRELKRIYRTKSQLKFQCEQGELSVDKRRNYDRSTFPFTSTCGEAVNYAVYGKDDYLPICDCLDEELEDRAQARSRRPRESLEPEQPQPGNQVAGGEDEGESSAKPPRGETKKLWAAKREAVVRFLDKAPTL